MKIGQIIKKNGENYRVYKILEYKIYAENLDGTNIICIQRPSYLKIVS